MTSLLTKEPQRTIPNQEPVLSSLVINTPYIFDSGTTAPTISKVHALPFGVRLTAAKIISGSLKLCIYSTVALISLTFVLISMLLPLNLENEKLLTSSKTLTNQQYILLAKAQKASTYERLFKKADKYEFNDAKEIIHIKDSNITRRPKIAKQKNNYSIQFSGF